MQDVDSKKALMCHKYVISLIIKYNADIEVMFNSTNRDIHIPLLSNGPFPDWHACTFIPVHCLLNIQLIRIKMAMQSNTHIGGCWNQLLFLKNHLLLIRYYRV